MPCGSSSSALLGGVSRDVSEDAVAEQSVTDVYGAQKPSGERISFIGEGQVVTPRTGSQIEQKAGFRGMLCLCSFLTPRHRRQLPELEETPPDPPRPLGQEPLAKAKAKCKAKGPPPPPPKARAASAPAALAVPSWAGPAPSPRWKAQRLVDWQPIRQPSRLQGSVWENVHKGIQNRGFGAIEDRGFTALKGAFMRTTDEPEATSSAVFKAPSVPRMLGKPLNADVLHAKLIRQGISTLKELEWAVGSPRQPTSTGPSPTGSSCKRLSGRASRDRLGDGGIASSSTSARSSCYVGGDGTARTICTSRGTSRSHSRSSSGSSSRSSSSDGSHSDSETDDGEEELAPLNEDALETLLSFYSAAEGSESQLLSRDAGKGPTLLLAPAEELLRQLLVEVGPLSVLQARAQALFHIARFHTDAQQLEMQFRLGITAAEAIVKSSTLPMLLEGVLLVGNYVNSSSNLGSALGVTLDSLAKLANTRRLPSSEIRPDGTETALSLVVQQLKETQGPSFLPTLFSELECCRSARSLDPKSMEVDVGKLGAQLALLEQRAAAPLVEGAGSEPPWLQPGHLRKFLADAKPQQETLQSLTKNLDAATISMRTYLAEDGRKTLKEMLTSLALFLDKLPVQPRQQSPLTRSKSLPSAKTMPRRSSLQAPPVRRATLTPLLAPRRPIVPPLQLKAVQEPAQDASFSPEMSRAALSAGLSPSTEDEEVSLNAPLFSAAALAPEINFHASAQDSQPSDTSAASSSAQQKARPKPPPPSQPISLRSIIGMSGQPTPDSLVPTPRTVLTGRGTPATPRDVNTGTLGTAVRIGTPRSPGQKSSASTVVETHIESLAGAIQGFMNFLPGALALTSPLEEGSEGSESSGYRSPGSDSGRSDAGPTAASSITASPRLELLVEADEADEAKAAAVDWLPTDYEAAD